MYIIDFEYDGEMLSDHNVILASISTTEDENVGLGTELTLNTIKRNDIDNIISSSYEEVLTWSFDIIKNPCTTDGSQEQMNFSEDEIYDLSVWLQQKKYKKLKIVYDDGSFSDVVYYGIFHMDAIQINDAVIGFSVKFTSNAPYAFGDETEISFNLDLTNSYFDLYNNSQDLGYLYPDAFIITCGSAGDINLINEDDSITTLTTTHSRSTVIENCVANEVITMDCKNRIITSSVTHDKLENDFNYNFPRLVIARNQIKNRFSIDTTKDNSITSMTITIRYSPIRKIGVI